jgi:hypothetical protein
MIDGQRSDRSKELLHCLPYEIHGRGVRDLLSGLSDRDLGQRHDLAQYRFERRTHGDLHRAPATMTDAMGVLLEK